MGYKNISCALGLILVLTAANAEAKKVVYCTNEAGAIADTIRTSLELAGLDAGYFFSRAAESCYEDEVDNDMEITKIQLLKHEQVAVESYFWNEGLHLPVKTQYFKADAYLNGELVMGDFLYKDYQNAELDEFDAAKAKAEELYSHCGQVEGHNAECIEQAFRSSGY